jgi:N6-L-threonylcarbamoyladenine synthase
MSKKPLILGIESSCDETAASIITENEQGIPIVLSNIVSSQVDVHKEFGGVVPELAARSHMEKIDWIVQKAINDSGKKIEEIDAVASTAGPRSDSMFVSWIKFWKSSCICIGKTLYCR